MHVIFVGVRNTTSVAAMSGCPLFVSLTAAPPSQGARRRGSPSRQEATRVPARQSRTGLPCCPCDRRLALPESRAPECPRPRATYGRLPVTRIQALVSKACLSRFLMVRGGCCPATPDCTSDATVPPASALALRYSPDLCFTAGSVDAATPQDCRQPPPGGCRNKSRAESWKTNATAQVQSRATGCE